MYASSKNQLISSLMGVYAHEKFHESHFCGTYVVHTLWVNNMKSLITRNGFDFKSKHSLDYSVLFIHMFSNITSTHLWFSITVRFAKDFFMSHFEDRTSRYVSKKVCNYAVRYDLVSEMFLIQSLTYLRH